MSTQEQEKRTFVCKWCGIQREGPKYTNRVRGGYSIGTYVCPESERKAGRHYFCEEIGGHCTTKGGFIEFVTPAVPDQRSTFTLPTDAAARKTIPIATGVMDYFPAALAAVAELSRKGNEKHNPGQPLHWSRGKSSDHADCILRHLIDRGSVDPEDGIPHSVKTAWRALALLQEELEAAGAPLARGAKLP